MRRYDIVSGILLILSIIDFALAAPVLVQEKRQACVDVVHIPRDVITVLGKRVDEELEKLAEEFFKTSGKPVESADAHTSPSSTPLGPNHGSKNVVQAPATNPASSTVNPNLLTESWDPSSTMLESSANPNTLMEPSSPASSIVSEYEAPSDWEEYEWVHGHEGDDKSHGPMYTPTMTSSGYGLEHELTWAQAPQPNPKKRPWTTPDGPGPDPDFDWDYWRTLEDPPLKRPALSKESGQANEYQVEHAQQPDPYYPMPAVHPPSTLPSEVTEPADEVVTPSSPNLGSPTQFEYEVVNRPPPSPQSTDPELHSDHQSLSTGSQPADFLAAIYAAKGKAKESRRISGTTRDIGNATQRELQPDERSLDSEE